MKARLANFWYHYKVPVLIAAVILITGGYLLQQQLRMVKSDYDVAVVSGEYYSEEQLSALQAVLVSLGSDINGDGAVVVRVHNYRLEIGADGQDSMQISALDADLVGKVSGLFLLQNPKKFEEATGGLCRSSEAVSCSETAELSGGIWDDLFLSVRQEADEKYAAMLAALTA